MAKVHPQSLNSSAQSPCYFTSTQETFTIWMKSLVLRGKGCTVFDSNGHVVYRVDNYKGSNQVHLMDLTGKVLFTILRRKFKLLGCWDGYRASDAEIDEKKTCFKVRKSIRFSGSACRAVVNFDKNQTCEYKIQSSWTAKSTCRIVDKAGGLIAEVKRKQLTSGLELGEDVLTMVVEPSMDHSLIVGLFVAYNLIIYRI